jgi:hypothetical protein
MVLALFAGCGGGGSTFPPPFGGSAGGFVQTGGSGGTGGASPTDPNVGAVVVDPGPQNSQYTNGLFVTVTLCEPGTSNCQTIDHLLVDTGSVGVRVLKSELQLALPPVQDTSGSALAECLPFVDGSSWGTVNVADLQVGGEAASSLPIQVIGEQNYPIAFDCVGTAITDFQTLGANGIFGVGVFQNDCGTDCAQPATSFQNRRLYYACSSVLSGGCQVTSVPVEQQVPNPVAAFPVDNNGVIIQLDGIPAGGAPSVSGLLVFGIGTQTNNELGGATVFPLDTVGVYVGTAFPIGGTQYTSYLDSGSNGLFFLNSTTTHLPMCTGNLKDFYCPSSTTSLSATVLGADGSSANVNFSVANASRLAARNYAFSNLAGPMPGFPSGAGIPGFDWGLPFFFGRRVYTGIEGKSTPDGIVGPYFAF